MTSAQRHRLGLRAGARALTLAATLAATSLGCGGEPEAPAHPTWADVSPILRGACTQCHGPTAATTGSVNGVSYRFDFFDMTSAVCGDAAVVLGGQSLARAWAPLIGADVTPPKGGGRARMPPAPGDPLTDSERVTLQRWAADPQRGDPPVGNRRPEIQLSAATAMADKSLSFGAVLSDPDDEAVVGVLQIGSLSLLMNRPGAFEATIDTSTWANGTYPVKASLCDGWGAFSYDLGNALITHPTTAK